MRIAIGQLWQETNTFNRNATTLADFENWGVATGGDVIAKYGNTGELSGFLKEAKTWDGDVEFVGLARYVCWPWGAVDAATWRKIRDDFIAQLEAAGPVDAVFLALHGAMSAEGEPDVTGAILELARLTVGSDVPIVGSLDLHGNITPRMVANADVLVGYHAAPHLDAVQTGERSAKALRWMLEHRGQKPVTYWRKLPMMTAAENHNTFTGIPAPLYRQLEAFEREPNVLSAGLYMVMAWFDTPWVGWTALITTTENDRGLREKLDSFCDACWELRHVMEDVERLPAKELVDRALMVKGHPVVIGDGADATNSGSPGDATELLREFLSRESIPRGALTFMVDPQAVAVAKEIGEGGAFDAPVGGRYSPEFSTPVQVKGTVEKILDMKWTLTGHIGNNLPIDMGTGAVVHAGETTILLVERSGPGSSPVLYETAGLDPRNFGMVVAKSPSGFRADYGSFAAEILLADTDGCAPGNLQRLTYEHVHRPLWPLNPIASMEEARWTPAGYV
ncbi:MAG: M81 family metallopeptidase [Planctomycetota bacterium]|nr:M81 family metallopeptidase [Planctomycetota bacterium]MDA1211186.1 M81 family metallopeptidase [Planctomycetota bacterium]